MEFFTIGVYNSSEIDFFNKLVKNQIDTFCDIRQRRGVRGAQYAFVNSNRLQQKLGELGIRYEYVPGLAPTAEVRAVQKEIDLEKGDLQRARQELGAAFVIQFKNKILDKFDFNTFLDSLVKASSDKIVLFCVEENHEACHRSIVAEKLISDYKITHL